MYIAQGNALGFMFVNNYRPEGAKTASNHNPLKNAYNAKNALFPAETDKKQALSAGYSHFFAV